MLDSGNLFVVCDTELLSCQEFQIMSSARNKTDASRREDSESLSQLFKESISEAFCDL